MLKAEGRPDYQTPQEIIEAKGLKQISDSGELEKLIESILAENAGQVEQYRSG